MAIVSIFKRTWRSAGLGCSVPNGYSVEPVSVEDIRNLCAILRQRGIEVFDIVEKDILSDRTSTLFYAVTIGSITQEHWECLTEKGCYLEPHENLRHRPPVRVDRPRYRYIKPSEVPKAMIQAFLEEKYLGEIDAKRRDSEVQMASEDGESENDSSSNA